MDILTQRFGINTHGHKLMRISLPSLCLSLHTYLHGHRHKERSRAHELSILPFRCNMRDGFTLFLCKSERVRVCL